jgi:hypothetical protein
MGAASGMLAWGAVLALGWIAAVAWGDEAALPPAANRQAEYETDIRPIFAAHGCFDCHGPDAEESGLRLDRRSRLLRGGGSGEPAILPKRSGESYLVRVVAGREELKMPPDGERLTAQEIALLRSWIDHGALMPGDDQGEELTTDFWSFRQIVCPVPPRIGAARAANPIDAFILAQLKENGLEPSPPVDRATLIRRLYLDVLGLPPTPEETGEFVADERAGAWPRLVERVLADPHYGERWARHWLDVVRFAETDGFEMNQERPTAWRYRDYVIGSFNEDKPYDRFVFEQLAGDAVGADAATGFLVGGAYDKVKSPDPALTLMQRQDELADIVNTTGTTFLGLTLGCARCHNHKFDPVLQKDYYSLQAVFAGVEHGERPLRDGPRDDPQKLLAEIAAERARIERELHELGIGPAVNARENVELFEPVSARLVRFTITKTNSGSEPCLDELQVFSGERNVALASEGATATASGTLAGFEIHQLAHVNDGRHGNERSWISNTAGEGWVQIELAEPAVIDRIVWSRDRNGKYSDRLAVEYRIDVPLEANGWRTIAGSASRLPFGADQPDVQTLGLPEAGTQRVGRLFDELSRLKSEQERLSSPPMVYAGRFTEPPATHRLYRGDPLAKREEVAPDALTVLGGLDLTTETPEQQRRIALARWIADAENPLTARVMVNRIWQHHFGTGLAPTPSDFGANGGRPSHPELLDWLASEFIDNGWSIKHVHRLILLSNTYRQSSAPRAEALAVDAGARLLWRFPPRRLEAEVIRDCMLHVAGVLDSRMGGPGFSVFEPNDNYVRVYTPKSEFGPAEFRRAIYMHKVRMEHDPVFGAFDAPDAGQVCPQRSRSTTAIQALNLFNSAFVAHRAADFAQRLRAECGTDAAAQVRRAFQLVFQREPDDVELPAARALVETHGLAALCRALFNANEFLFMP